MTERRAEEAGPVGELAARGRAAILIVNGFRPRTFDAREEARRYPWIGLCLSQLQGRSAGVDFDIHVVDNSGLPEHHAILHAANRIYLWPVAGSSGMQLPHRRALDVLVELVDESFEYLVFMDSDAVPVADNWLLHMVEALEQGVSLVGVWRDEMAPQLRPFVHPSCMCIRRSELLELGITFAKSEGQDVGQELTDELVRRGRRVAGLERSNAVNAHFLIGGIYGDLVYHHGAGSRAAAFWTSVDPAHDEQIRRVLMDAAFGDFDHLIDVLRGKAPNDIWRERAPTTLTAR